MSRTWLYFGCHGESGHFLFERGMRHAAYELTRQMAHFDGLLAPHPEQYTPNELQACFARLDGLGYSAISFWDRTVDDRPGSNSTFFSPGACDPERLFRNSMTAFPEVWKRPPRVRLAGTELVLCGGAAK